MEMAKVTSKGQITIPISIRKRLDIKEGDKILFLDRAEGVMMLNPDMLQKEAAESAPAGISIEVPAGLSENVPTGLTERIPTGITEHMSGSGASENTLTGESNTGIPENSTLNQQAADSPIAAAATKIITPVTAQTTAQTMVPEITRTTTQATISTTAQAEAAQTTAEIITTKNEKPSAENAKKSVGDVDLSTLLDEIRSFNTNI